MEKNRVKFAPVLSVAVHVIIGALCLVKGAPAKSAGGGPPMPSV